MDFTFLWQALVTMLVTLDPLGLAPIFVSLTIGMTPAERRGVAVRACLIALAILTFFGLGGQFAARCPRNRPAGLPYRGRLAAVLHRLRNDLRAPRQA